MTETLQLGRFLKEPLTVVCNTVVTMVGELVYEASFLHLHSRHRLQCRKSGNSIIIECCTCNEVLAEEELGGYYD